MSERPKRVTPPKQSEAQIERAVVTLLTHAGCHVYRVSGAFGNQRGGTRLTPGLADLIVMLPAHTTRQEHTIATTAPGTHTLTWHPTGGIGFFETKTPLGLREHLRLAPLPAPPTPSQMKAWRKVRAQAAFGQECRERGIPYAMGGVEEAWQFLASVGLAVRVTWNTDSNASGHWHLTRPHPTSTPPRQR